MEINVPKDLSGLKRRLSDWEKSIRGSQWKKSAAPLLLRMHSLHLLLKKRTCAHPDCFFFSIEDLPYFGKEYWFMHFVVPASGEQLIMTAGRAQGRVFVNKKNVKGNAGKSNPALANCAAVCWMHSGKKEVLIDSTGEVGIKNYPGGNRMFFRKGKNELSIQGAYPRFQISLKKGSEEIFSARATARKKGVKWEMPRLLENPLTKEFGAIMVNYFFDFEGSVHKKKIKGKAYLQKVVTTMPLAPWNWVRIQFEKNAALDFFTAKPFGDISQRMHVWSNCFFELDGKRTKLHNIELVPPASGKKLWVLNGKNLFLSMQPYSLQRFSMRQNTQFHYNEHLVRAKDFFLQIGRKKYSLNELGQARGILEDAYGYLL